MGEQFRNPADQCLGEQDLLVTRLRLRDNSCYTNYCLTRKWNMKEVGFLSMGTQNSALHWLIFKLKKL